MAVSANAVPPDAPPAVPFAEALRVWLRIAALSFGGPAGQIAVMHRILVAEKRWLSEERFLHALNYCMLLPGPEAQQLATYTGWLLHGVRGGLTAGVLFILPGFLSILALSVLYAGFQGLAAVEALFFGLKPAVLAVVVEAVLRVGRRALHGPGMVALAVAAFVAIFFYRVPFPWIVLSAAGVGLLGARFGGAALGGRPVVEPVGAASHLAARGAARALRVLGTCLALWLVPLLILALTLGRSHVFVTEGVFFSKAAMVTFGGAYAVLAYIGQQAVENFGWLQPAEMLDGLGLAETTPGPLIQVVQFVGFLGAYRSPGELSPMVAGVIGSVITTWVTFVPCFLWIFLGAPSVERLRGHRALGGALRCVTAAVVGVMLNLAVWFFLHTVFAEVREVERWGATWMVPGWRTLDPLPVLIAAGAFVALLRFRVGMVTTLAACVVVGGLCHWLR